MAPKKSKLTSSDHDAARFNRNAMYCALLGSMVLALMGILILIAAGRLTWISARSGSWPKTAGMILTSEIVREQSGKSSVRHCPTVVYSFEVNGISYRGDRIVFKELRMQRMDKAQTILSVYPPGKKVDVYYQPSNPERCILEPGFHVFQVVHYLCFGFLFLTVGIIFSHLCWDNILEYNNILRRTG